MPKYQLIISVVITALGILYQYKYYAQGSKITRLGTAKGISKTYFLWGIGYESLIVCLALAIDNWLLAVLSLFPLIGNSAVLWLVLKYTDRIRGTRWDDRLYRTIKRSIK